MQLPHRILAKTSGSFLCQNVLKICFRYTRLEALFCIPLESMVSVSTAGLNNVFWDWRTGSEQNWQCYLFHFPPPSSPWKQFPFFPEGSPIKLILVKPWIPETGTLMLLRRKSLSANCEGSSYSRGCRDMDRILLQRWWDLFQMLYSLAPLFLVIFKGLQQLYLRWGKLA